MFSNIVPTLAAIDPFILAFSAITVIVTIWMGFWSAKKSKTASDFFVAGRSVSVGWNASAISGEYLSAASFMGVAGMVMSSGYDALWYPVCYACGYLFLLLFIAGPLRRFGAYTIPDFAEGRFDSPLFRKIAVVFVLFIGFFYTMPQMKGAGTTLAYIFQDLDLRGGWFEFLAPHGENGEALKGFPYWAGVLVVGAVITLNVALGGMKGITLVQAFQYWLKMFAISVPVFVLMAVHGHYGAQLGRVGAAPAALTNIVQDLRPALGWTNIAPVKTEFSSNSDTTFAPSNPMLCWLHPLLEQCADASGNRYLVAKELEQAEVLFGNATEMKAARFVRAVEATLARTPVEYRDATTKDPRREPVFLLRDETNTVKVLPASKLDAYRSAGLVNADASGRAALPAKAPSDGAWLNPFGPLTTKAASAAGISGESARPFALLYTYSLIIALVCGTAGLPHILVRFYTNPNGVAAKRTTMWVMILIGVFYLFPPIFGAMGRNLLPDLYAASGAKGTDKVVLELPRLLNDHVPMLGSILSGITCAGAFAAFMSTFSGLLVSMTGALAHDIYGRILRPQATPDDRLRAFKYCAVIVGGVAVLLGTQVEPLQINFMVGQAFAIAAASYFPLLFMSTWWRGMTMKGAACGMLGGGLAALACTTIINLSDLKHLDLAAFWAAHPLIRILCEQPAIWTVPLAIALMLVVSKLTQREVPSDIRMKMLVLHAPEELGLKQEYIQEHQHGH